VQGEARIMMIDKKRFYVITLFQPQLSSTAEKPHPLILSYLSAVRDFNVNK
jgi:CTP synthase (UTP-ammonia lyase)